MTPEHIKELSHSMQAAAATVPAELLPPADLSAASHASLVSMVRDVQSRSGHSRLELANMMRFNPSNIGLWLNDRFGGQPDTVADKRARHDELVRTWLAGPDVHAAAAFAAAAVAADAVAAGAACRSDVTVEQVLDVADVEVANEPATEAARAAEAATSRCKRRREGGPILTRKKQRGHRKFKMDQSEVQSLSARLYGLPPSEEGISVLMCYSRKSEIMGSASFRRLLPVRIYRPCDELAKRRTQEFDLAQLCAEASNGPTMSVGSTIAIASGHVALTLLVGVRLHPIPSESKERARQQSRRKIRGSLGLVDPGFAQFREARIQDLSVFCASSTVFTASDDAISIAGVAWRPLSDDATFTSGNRHQIERTWMERQVSLEWCALSQKEKTSYNQAYEERLARVYQQAAEEGIQLARWGEADDVGKLRRGTGFVGVSPSNFWVKSQPQPGYTAKVMHT
jgi:hypothetical protein